MVAVVTAAFTSALAFWAFAVASPRAFGTDASSG
jgi:hypothetical protein